MNAIPDIDLEGDDTKKRLERLLYSLKGEAMPAVNVMEAIGIEFTIQRDNIGALVVIPHSAYVQFYCLAQRVSRFFESHGYHLNYYGNPFADVFVVPFRRD